MSKNTKSARKVPTTQAKRPGTRKPSLANPDAQAGFASAPLLGDKRISPNTMVHNEIDGSWTCFYNISKDDCLKKLESHLELESRLFGKKLVVEVVVSKPTNAGKYKARQIQYFGEERLRYRPWLIQPDKPS